MLALTLAGALPAAAQSTEFGVLLGGSSRASVKGTKTAGDGVDEGFSFSNNSVDIYYSRQLEPDTNFKIKAGRIQGAVAFPDDASGGRLDVDGELQHIDGLIEYRFSEIFGSTGLFAGVGLYRAQGGNRSETDYGFSGGVNADFPLSRNYGVIVEGTYHVTNLEYRPRYVTVSGGLRFSF